VSVGIKITIGFCFAFTLSACAGGTIWARHASDSDIRAASDFDLCREYLLTYKLNDGIKREILNRGLLTEEEANQLETKQWPGIHNGDKKYAVFTNGYWKSESENVAASGHTTEVWRYLDCEPSILTLFGATCGYVDVTFEDNLVSKQECYETRLKDWCEGTGLVNLAHKSD
jgi:hypothetical protein